VRSHPQLLQSSNQLPAKLATLSELLCLAPSIQQQQVAASDSLETQRPGGEPAPTAANALVLDNPQLACVSPRALRARFAELQAACGLSEAALAATLRAQPRLLVEAAPSGSAWQSSTDDAAFTSTRSVL